MQKLFIAAAMLCTLQFYSCNKETSIIEQNELIDKKLTVPTDSKIVPVSDKGTRNLSPGENETKEDLLTEKFALSVANSLTNNKIRAYLKIEANKQFDGDYDILFSRNRGDLLGNTSLQDILLFSGQISENELQQLIDINPNLNISIPVNIEKWITDTQAPIVTYLPSTYEENVTKQVTAFDYNGNKYLVDAISEPSVPLIVIGTNERTDKNGNVREYPKTENKNLRTDEVSGVCVYPFRTNSKYERLAKVNMNVRAYEGFLKSKAELRIRCFSPDLKSGSSNPVILIGDTGYMGINVYRKQSNKWIDRDISLFFWENTSYGQTVLMHFTEEDGYGKDVDLNISETFKINEKNSVTGGVKFSIKSSDKDIGRTTVFQFPCPPYYENDINFYKVNDNFSFSLNSL